MMIKDTIYQDILRDIEEIPVISDHEHHLPDSFFAGTINLDTLIANTYVAWMGYSPEVAEDWKSKLLSSGRFNSYFVFFEKGLQKVHQLDLDITLDNWNRISERVQENYRLDPDFHWKQLMLNGYKKIILDTYWNPGSDEGHSELFVPTFRIDKFMYGFHPLSVAPNDIIPWQLYSFTGKTLDDYVENMCMLITNQWEEGKVVALKCAEAYNRHIDFSEDNKELATQAFGIHPEQISSSQFIYFGNYIFNRCCELAAKLEIPFQIHTGLGQLEGSNPLRLESIIAKHPDTRFVLFHSGFPWTLEVAALSHNYENVCPSFTWTSTISPAVSTRALDEYIDIVRSIDTITWGSDCWVPEESVGALIAWREIVSTVLARRYVENRIKPGDIDILARKFLYENNKHVYGLVNV